MRPTLKDLFLPDGTTWWQDALGSFCWIALVVVFLILAKACEGEGERGGEEGGGLVAGFLVHEEQYGEVHVEQYGEGDGRKASF